MAATGFTLRPPTDDDIPGLMELFVEGGRELGIDSTARPEDFTIMWSTPGFDRTRHYRVAEAQGTVVGSVGFFMQDGEANGGGNVARAWRGRGVGSGLLSWMIEAARKEPELKDLYTSAITARPDAIALIESFGFEYARTFFRMVNHSPDSIGEPEWPDGVHVDTSLRGEALIDAIVEAHDNSFIDHWNFHPMRREDIAHQIQHPNVELDLIFIAFGGDGRVAGLNLCILDRGESFCRGVVGVLGTTRPFRGIGLGRALLRHGVRKLVERGATEVELGVDSENPSGALALYQHNGFDLSFERRAYRLAL